MSQRYIWRIMGRLPGLNEVTAVNRRNRYAGAKQKRQVESVIAVQLQPRPSLTGKYHVHLTWYEPSKRRDPDNIASAIKFVLDAMQEVGILSNDGWEHIISLHHAFVVADDYAVKIEFCEA